MSGQIVVGIDGSDVSIRAALWAARRAELTGDELVLVNAYELPSLLSPFSLLTPPDAAGQLAELGRSICSDTITKLREHGIGAKLAERVIEGRAGPALVGVAGSSSMLVVGATGSGLADRITHGRMARYVAHHARGPLVIVP